ncbi:ParA (plasmid) [Planktothrix agardhii]|nr:ParA [Planktothrix agardhii]CAD5985085.1 ParA [Planktothrix agardhii]
MGIIALINQKGGAGKSTSSVHLAYWLQFKQNYRVLLVDADAQRSSSQWVAGMGIELACQVIQSPDDILEKIPELIKDYDYLVIDGPASLSEETRAILFRCDLAVIPVQPTGVDLRSASDAMRLLKQATGSVCAGGIAQRFSFPKSGGEEYQTQTGGDRPFISNPRC